MKQIIFFIAVFITFFSTGIKAFPSAPAVIDENFIKTFDIRQNKYADFQKLNTGGKDSILINVHTVPEHSYNAQINIPTIADIKKEDILLASFLFRSTGDSDETGEAKIEVVFEGIKEPRNGYSSGKISAGKEWREIFVPIVSKVDFKAREAQLNIRLGFAKQTLEIKDIILINYKKSVDIRDLPSTKFTYLGREDDAPWRKAALERIEKIRKNDLFITVTKNNIPQKNVKINIIQIRQEFKFGTAVNSNYLTEKFAETPDGERYRKEIKELFNFIVDEGELKWPQWEGTQRNAGIKMVEWSIKNNIPMRGHNLIWERFDRMPADIEKNQSDKSFLKKRVLEHIREEVSFFKGKLVEWDVVNEPMTNRILRDILGNEAIGAWYAEARKADPGTKLYLNEYSIEGTDDQKLAKFCELLEFFKKKDIPLDGIGTQCHIGMNAPAIDKILESFDKLGSFVNEIKVTEYDMDSSDENIQADFTRDILTAAFSHPKVNGFIIWGFWDGRHWKLNSPIYRKDWSLKPAGEVWKELVLNKWMTKAEGVTDNNGKYSLMAFRGEYEITIISQDKIIKKNIVLSDIPLSLNIELE